MVTTAITSTDSKKPVARSRCNHGVQLFSTGWQYRLLWSLAFRKAMVVSHDNNNDFEYAVELIVEGV